MEENEGLSHRSILDVEEQLCNTSKGGDSEVYGGVEMEALGVRGVVSGRVLVGLGCVLGDGCRGTHG